MTIPRSVFARVTEKQYLAGVDRSKGWFRSVMVAPISHFLCNRLDAQRTLKRGGGCDILPIETEDVECQGRREPSHTSTPEAQFEHHWAVTLLDRIFNRPCAEYAGPDFNWLKPFLVGEAERGQIASTAAEMGISDGVFKVAVHRLRKRYPEALRTESSETVSKARPGARGDTLFVGGPCP